MKSIKKNIAVILSFVIIFSVFALCFSASAKTTITDIKIIRIPDKTVLYKDVDWVYGTWDVEESLPDSPVLNPSDKISFTHNPCGGIYPDRGMLDMTGLVIEVSYSDGTKQEMKYTETLSKTGYYKANILVSPKGGVSYFVGVNTMEVYLAENKRCYDSFDVEFVGEQPAPEPHFGIKEGSSTIIDGNGFITGLKTNLTANQLFNNFIEYNDVEVSVTKAISSSRYLGTGSVVNVKYPDGHEENYTIVIYGDVDGDSAISSADVIQVSSAVSSGIPLNSAQSKAANVDGVRRITTSDIVVISSVVSGGSLNQVKP